MDRFKFEIFKKENPKTPMFEVVPLTLDKIQIIQKKLFQLLNIEDNNIQELEKRIYQIANVLIPSIPENNFSIKELFYNLNVESNFLYVTWDSFKTIDRFKLTDFCQWFEYIWYPSSDDIDIFNDDLTWILQVYHYETIALAQLEKFGKEIPHLRIGLVNHIEVKQDK